MPKTVMPRTKTLQMSFFTSAKPQAVSILEGIIAQYGFKTVTWDWYHPEGFLARRTDKSDPLGPGIVISRPGQEDRPVYSERGLQEALGVVR